MSANPQSGQPRDRLVQIDVTFILPRRLGWLLAGIAIGNLHLPNGLLEKAGIILRALLHGVSDPQPRPGKEIAFAPTAPALPHGPAHSDEPRPWRASRPGTAGGSR